jgi:hypothetical protein
VSDFAFSGEPGHTRCIPAPLADAVRADLSGIDHLVSFRYFSPDKLSLQIKNSGKPTVFKQPQHIIFADAAYFNLLPYRWIAGNKQSATSQEGQVVLIESRAKLYFPNSSFADMIGQQITYDDSITAHVSGMC